MIRKLLIGCCVLLAATSVVFFMLWQNEQAATTGEATTMVDTTSWAYVPGWRFNKTDTLEIENTVYQTRYDTTGDTVYKDSLVYIYPPDTFRSYALTDTIGTLGDSTQLNGIIHDSLRVRGELLHQEHTFDLSIPQRQRTITRTETRYVQPYKHRIYVGGGTDKSVSAMYAHTYFEAGYRYNLNLDRHAVEARVNVLALIRELSRK